MLTEEEIQIVKNAAAQIRIERIQDSLSNEVETKEETRDGKTRLE